MCSREAHAFQGLADLYSGSLSFKSDRIHVMARCANDRPVPPHLLYKLLVAFAYFHLILLEIQVIIFNLSSKNYLKFDIRHLHIYIYIFFLHKY